MDRAAFGVLIGVLVAGCSPTATETTATPVANLVTTSASKIPGNWVAQVDASRFIASIKSSTPQCSVYDYPLNAGPGFEASVRATLPSVFQNIEVSGGRGSGRNVVIISSESLDSQLRGTARLFDTSFTAEVNLSASVAVEGSSGRLFGRSFSGRGLGSANSNGCDGGGQALRSAAEQAQRDLLRKVAEELSNSERVRRAR